MDNSGMLKIGPDSKKVGGTMWDYGGKRITKNFISHGKVINFLKFQYVDDDGKLVVSHTHGGSPGPKFEVIKLREFEDITGVSGTLNCFIDENSADDEPETSLELELQERAMELRAVTSITFTTDVKKYGPFGKASSGDHEFNFEAGGLFKGFFGTYYDYLTSIGVYVAL